MEYPIIDVTLRHMEHSLKVALANYNGEYEKIIDREVARAFKNFNFEEEVKRAVNSELKQAIKEGIQRGIKRNVEHITEQFANRAATKLWTLAFKIHDEDGD